VTEAHAQGSSSPDEKPQSWLGALGRLVIQARQRPLAVGLPLVLGLVAVIGGLSIGGLFFFSGKSEDVTVESILRPFDHRQLETAREQAIKLRKNPELGEAQQSACLFVLGCILAEEAETSQPTQRRLLNLIAARYLDLSRQLGFPHKRGPRGLLVLGRCLYRANRYAQAVPILKEALAQNPDSAIELEQALTDCYQKQQPPQLKQALVHTERLLALPNLSPRERDQALLLEANIHFQMRNLVACEAALTQILETSSSFPHAQALAARVHLQRLPTPQPGQKLSAADAQPIRELIATLQPFAERRGLEQEVTAQLHLLLAECHERLSQPSEAAALYARLRKAHYGSPEALAAMFFEADWLASAGHVEESLALYRRGLKEAGPGDEFNNIWLTKAEVEERLGLAIRRYQEAKAFPEAVELAEAAASLLPLAQSLIWQAEIQRNWSADLLSQQAGRPRHEQLQLQAEARAHLREAAARDEELAAARIATRSYPDDLLRAANTYLQGQGYQQAERLFRQYLQQQTRTGQPEALVGLGQALIALGRPSEAIIALRQVEQLFQKHPASYQARLLAASALQELGKLDEARQVLGENLFDSALTPQSIEWRESLFALGRIQFLQGLEHESRGRALQAQESTEDRTADIHREMELAASYFAEAIKTLTEATQRFPDSPQMVAATYYVAEAYRRGAKWPQQRLESVSVDSTRQSLRRQMQNDLTAAVAEYTRLIEKLADDQESQRSIVDLKILRNCYFNRADALFDLGRFEEAIQAYSAATNRYQHEPEALEAYVQIANCYRRLQRYAEARGTLEQARVVLERIRSDADFARTTRFDRQEWAQLLEWYSNL
jgi:tetratricopeptide (TPR) repeat protein